MTEFSRGMAGWSALTKVAVSAFAGLGFELTVIFCIADMIIHNISEAIYLPDQKLGALQWSILTSMVAVMASYVVEGERRKVFLL